MTGFLAKRTKVGRAEFGVITKTVGTQAPLATVWTEPASCVTAIPTISAGTCNTKSCSAYPATSVARVLSINGASVNYPDFTTDQAQTSTECMPSGYANLGLFYFSSGSQCPLSWATATVASGSTYKTIVCCPAAYPSPISNSGGGNFDCYTVLPLTAGQQFVLHAKGDISSTVTASTESEWVPYWESESVIGTTQWPTATTASVYHPGVNFLIQLPTSTQSSSSGSSGSSGNSSSTSSPSFSIFALSLGGSIGVLVGIAVVGIICLACLCTIFRCVRGRRRGRSLPPSALVNQTPNTQYAPPPQYPYPGPLSSPPPPGQYNVQPLAYQSKGPGITSHAI